MAISRIGGKASVLPQGNDSDDEMKPLVREYGKANPDIYNEYHPVNEIRISKNGSWCMIHTDNYVLLMKTSATAVRELYNDIIPNIAGKKANRLVVEPVKKDRYGGCIGVDDSVQVYYSFDEKTLEVTISEEGLVDTGKKQAKLSLEMFMAIPEQSASTPTNQKSTEGESSTTATTTRMKTKNISTSALRKDG